MKKCLIVVDYQNDFVDGTLGFEAAKSIESIIVDKIENYLEQKEDIIFTFDTHFDNYLTTQEGKRLPILHCIKGSKGHLLYGNVGEYLKDAKVIFEKNTFGSLELGIFLKNQEYTHIELVGLVTNMCVISNAVIAKSALPEARIIVDSKAVKSFDERLHFETLNVLKGMQIDVL